MKADNGHSKLVGAYLKTPLSDYLNLLSAHRRVSKSHIIKEIFLNWYNYQLERRSLSKLIEEMIYAIQAEWNSKSSRCNNPKEKQEKFEIFCCEIRAELLRKKINLDIITVILTNVKI